MLNLGIKNLKRIHTRLLKNFTPIARIYVGMKILTFITKALAVGVNNNREWDVMFLELVANGDIAIRRCVQIPCHRMGTREMTIGHSAQIKRHIKPGTVVISGTTYFS